MSTETASSTHSGPLIRCRELPGQLAADQCGAIVIIGIAAGAALALGLWHLVRVGDAAIWRETVQNAADAGAFDNAVLQARGMNVLVFLNLVMALVMSVLLLWRVAEILIVAATIAVGVACGWTGFACAALPKLADLDRWFISKDPSVSDKVVKICAGINVVEKVVATIVPPYAMGHAMVKTTSDYPVDSVFVLSPSIGTPTLVTDGTFTKGFKDTFLKSNNVKQQITDCFKKAAKPATKEPTDNRGQAWDKVAQRRMGLVFSLPVQEGSLSTLCTQAGKFFTTTLPSLFAGHEVNPLGWTGGLVDSLFGSVPNLFCAPANAGTAPTAKHRVPNNKDKANSTSVPKSAEDQLNKQIENACNGARVAFDRLPDKEKAGAKYNDGNDEFDMKQCKTDAKAKTKDSTDALDKTGDQVTKCVKPADVWTMTSNGTLFMQSFSWADKSAPFPAASVRAQAEMYFDCTDQWNASSCKSLAMWRPRWRARLRRVQPLADLLKQQAGVSLGTGISVAVNTLADAVSESLFGKAFKPLNLPIIKDWKAKFERWERDKTSIGPSSDSSDLIH
jgi:hypothetical protein